jgi:hypothetical protein
MKKAKYLTFFAAAVLLAGCDSSPKKTETPSAAKQTATNDSETGRFGLQHMLPAARLWNADAKPVRVESVTLGGSDGHDGKSPFWRGTFGSAARQKAITFTWSGVASPDTPKGVNHGPEDSYNPANRSEQGYDLAYLKTDSDQAFEVAQKHGGKELLDKNPKQQVIYLLDWDSRTDTLNWHVIYGDSESSAKLTVIVNASEGRFVHKE